MSRALFKNRTPKYTKIFFIFLFLFNVISYASLGAACTISGLLTNPDGCSGAGTGSADFFLNPIETGRTFVLTGPVFQSGVFSINAHQQLNGLPSGDYTLTCTTTAGTCTAHFHVDLISVNPIFIIIGHPNLCACDGQLIFSNVTPSGNIFGPFSYTFSLTGANGYSNSVDTNTNAYTFTGICGGNYSYTITVHGWEDETQERSCNPSTSGSVFLFNGGPTPIASITGNTSPYTVGDPINLNGHPSSVTPPGPGLTYLWTGPSFTATTQNIGPITASLATAGTYFLKVCNPSGDTSCCDIASTIVTVNNPCTLQINSVDQTTPPCIPQATGEVQVSFTGGTGNIFYKVDAGSFIQVPSNISPFIISGLAAGPHVLTMQDSSQPACSAVHQFTVTGLCCLQAEASNPQPSCANINNGSVDITLSNASGQVSYSADGMNYTNASTNPFTVFNLPVGMSTIFVQDASSISCQPVQVQVTIDTRPSPTVSIIGVLDVCGAILPTLTALPSGGVAPYTYLWTPGNITTQTISETGPGTYSVVVFDQNGCSSTNSVKVNADLTAAITPAYPSICPNGSVLLTALPMPAGPGTYNYSWTCCNSPDVISTQPTVLATQVGTYTVTITDPNFPACKAVVSIEVVASASCGQFDPLLCCKVHDDKGAVTVTLTNTGTGPIAGIVVSDLLPSCFTFKKGMSEDNWTFVSGQPVLARFNGILQPGQTTSFTLIAKAKCDKSKCSFVVNQVSVTGLGAPPASASCIIKI